MAPMWLGKREQIVHLTVMLDAVGPTITEQDVLLMLFRRKLVRHMRHTTSPNMATTIVHAGQTLRYVEYDDLAGTSVTRLEVHLVLAPEEPQS